MKKFLLLVCLSFVTSVFAQSYRVTIETFVGNKLEDKFSFTMSQGESQEKGFDSKLLAKRYRAKGFPHRVLQAEEVRKAFEEKLDQEAAQKPIDRVKAWLGKAQAEFSSFDTRILTMNGKKEKLAEQIKELENLVELSSRGSASFRSSYQEYLKKYSFTDEDIKVKKMINKRPRNTGDIEEIELGSFCKITMKKSSDKKVMLDVDYSYARIHSYFYADGNNNSNTITKHPVVERFEKFGVSDLVVSIAKPYCFQFTRLSASKIQSLSDAIAESGIFGSGDPSKPSTSVEDPELTALDAQGVYSSIKKKYASDAGRVIRMVISVRPER